jgi:hypothetical protein
MTAGATQFDDHVILNFPYNVAFIEDLKNEIPKHGRRYDPELRVWTVMAPWDDLAIEMFTECWPDAQVVYRGVLGFRREQKTTASSTTKTDPDMAVLFVTPDAPSCVIEAAYRALSRTYHPDRGGSNEQMQRLNAAMDRIRFRTKAA